MDRQFFYAGAIPLATDHLSQARFTQTGLGLILKLFAGTQTLIEGFACVPTSPASMTVTVGLGSLAMLSVVDQNAYAELPADDTPLMKQGWLGETPVNFTLTAPTTPGEQITYVIEAALEEVDTTAVVLPYFNTVDPSQAYLGAANDATAQNTVRSVVTTLRLLVGPAGLPGTNTSPAIDTGYVPLCYIVVPYGATSIGAADIAAALGAPYLPMTVPELGNAVKYLATAQGVQFNPVDGTQLYTLIESLIANGNNTLAAAYEAEVAARKAADASLASSIGTETARAEQAESNLGSLVASEAATRAAADSNLGTLLSSESATRAAADSSLGSLIATETSVRGSAVTSLNGLITAEAAARTSADGSLASSISGEATTRASADSALTSAVGAVSSALAAAQRGFTNLVLFGPGTPNGLSGTFTCPVSDMNGTGRYFIQLQAGGGGGGDGNGAAGGGGAGGEYNEGFYTLGVGAVITVQTGNAVLANQSGSNVSVSSGAFVLNA